MLEELLKKLGANAKTTIGVSVSPGVGLEMIVLDPSSQIVNKYGYRPLEYDYSKREIQDYDEFKTALLQLFNELRISKESNILLNMPNVTFNTISLPMLLPDEGITNAIISEVEESYIFKKEEPLVSWLEAKSDFDTENKFIVYSAIQKSVLDKITSICMEIGCTLVGVENSYASFLKALDFAGGAAENMKEGSIWNLMIIGQTQYSFFSMSGKNVVDYYEEPLALKSFVGDEIYNAITTSAEATLANLPANYLFVASETDLVSAEVLSMRLSFDGKIDYLESNKYKQDPLMPVNLEVLPNVAACMTPEAIGAGIYGVSDYPLKFNLMGQEDASKFEVAPESVAQKITIGNVEFEITKEIAYKIVIIITAIILLPVAGLVFGLPQLTTKNDDKAKEIAQEIKQVESEISQFDTGKTTFDSNSKINSISSQNRKELLYLSSLRYSVPKNVWVTYYMTNSSNKVDIKGRSTDVESVYKFYKNIKDIVTNSNVKLYKLEIVTDSIDDVIEGNLEGSKAYEFEITNMSSQELSALNPPEEETSSGAGSSKSSPKYKPGGLPPNLKSIKKF